MRDFPSQPNAEYIVPETVTVEVPISAGQSSYQVKDSSLENVNIIGLYVRPTGKKTRSNIATPATACYNATFLSVKNQNVNLIDSFPIDYFVTPAGSYGKLDLPAGIRIDDFKLYIADSAVALANTAYELNFIVIRNC